MGLPEIVDIVKIKDWNLEVVKENSCYLYDFEAMGITPDQFKKIIVGRPAILFEKLFRETVSGMVCPWCGYKAKRNYPKSQTLQYHIFKHQGKNILSYQLVKLQKEMHTLKLQLVRRGYHEALPFFVEHSCQDCANPVSEGREGMCALPVSSRPRMRSLRLLSYPIKHLLEHPKRKYKWSALGVIVLMKNELNPGPELL